MTRIYGSVVAAKALMDATPLSKLRVWEGSRLRTSHIAPAEPTATSIVCRQEEDETPATRVRARGAAHAPDEAPKGAAMSTVRPGERAGTRASSAAEERSVGEAPSLCSTLRAR